jgi:hypothetical protein
MMFKIIKPMARLFIPFIIFFLISGPLAANRLLIPMDDSQKNHLKAYGITYWILSTFEIETDWLLNYRGGSFMVPFSHAFAAEMTVRGVSYEVISEAQAASLISQVSAPDVNMDAVKLQKGRCSDTGNDLRRNSI